MEFAAIEAGLDAEMMRFRGSECFGSVPRGWV